MNNSNNVSIEVSVIHIDYFMLLTQQDMGFVSSSDGPLPVVRIFGSTPAGQRACVFIHGVINDSTLCYFVALPIYDSIFFHVIRLFRIFIFGPRMCMILLFEVKRKFEGVSDACYRYAVIVEGKNVTYIIF